MGSIASCVYTEAFWAIFLGGVCIVIAYRLVLNLVRRRLDPG
jgi:hypothetical protein